ncbi:PucR family transcriptional regulator [Citricoccus muralis]|uniref:Helix-turn-helix domain-containing protein n=1 Tax=Citricoccus muralis TaxID=169134 RepID=A0ABY8HB44_9MICC|nr:PucR family transcriptional regulator [Citricoccus muralis]WFP17792.1 helix-turn-helix domain-containing protein [Citricoccus muralis]
MPESRSPAAPRPLSPEALSRLTANLGSLKTATMQRLDGTLPWYRSLPADQRSALSDIAQQGLQSFVEWLANPTPINMNMVLSRVFGEAPSELSRYVSLHRALQLMRTVLDVVETQAPALVHERDRGTVREAVLFYSREIAFALAEVYARAAETRGAWDSRLEALLLDTVLRGEDPDEIRSRAAAVGWKNTWGHLVIAGPTPDEDQPTLLASIRRVATRGRYQVLIGVHSERLVLVVGSVTDAAETAERFIRCFAPGPVVYGSVVPDLVDAHSSAKETLAGLAAAPAWPRTPRPVPASDLLPERALRGDPTAVQALCTGVYQPLLDAGNSLLETVDTYCDLGHSLEGTAREMFIHANTVRYRLRRVAELTGWDPLAPRDAYVLQIALTVGRLQEDDASA